MSNELNNSEIEVNQKDSIEKFTFLELVKHPIDTAKFIVTALPATVDFFINSFKLESSFNRFGEDDPSNVEKVTSSAERMVAALDLLKGVNLKKAEKIQTRMQTIIAEYKNR